MENSDRQVEIAKQLIFRLERLSADSYWAHQASGLRGALLKCLEQLETHSETLDLIAIGKQREDLERLIQRGFEILTNGAREIREPMNPLG